MKLYWCWDATAEKSAQKVANVVEVRKEAVLENPDAAFLTSWPHVFFLVKTDLRSSSSALMSGANFTRGVLGIAVPESKGTGQNPEAAGTGPQDVEPQPPKTRRGQPKPGPKPPKAKTPAQEAKAATLVETKTFERSCGGATEALSTASNLILEAKSWPAVLSKHGVSGAQKSVVYLRSLRPEAMRDAACKSMADYLRGMEPAAADLQDGCVLLNRLGQEALANGIDGDALIVHTQRLTTQIAQYKTGVSSVKSLIPKAKSRAKAKAQA